MQGNCNAILIIIMRKRDENKRRKAMAYSINEKNNNTIRLRSRKRHKILICNYANARTKTANIFSLGIYDFDIKISMKFSQCPFFTSLAHTHTHESFSNDRLHFVTQSYRFV